MKRLLPALLAVFPLVFLGCAEPRMPESYALVYGVADYADPDRNLNYTDDDAEDLAALLRLKGWNVEVRIDEDATLTQLEADVAAVSAVIPDDGRFLFYFSGHGGYVELEGLEPNSASSSDDEFILLYDSYQVVVDYAHNLASLQDVLDITLSDDSAARLFSQVPADNRIIILDSCNSGGFIGDGITVDTTSADYLEGEIDLEFYAGDAVDQYFNYSPSGFDLSGGSFITLTAAGEDEKSREKPELQHGIFTYFLLLSPANADYNLDGYISMSEAYRYIAVSLTDYQNDGDVAFDGTNSDFYPHLSAFPIDPVLFEAD